VVVALWREQYEMQSILLVAARLAEKKGSATTEKEERGKGDLYPLSYWKWNILRQKN
jgi:hypothetical protein